MGNYTTNDTNETKANKANKGKKKIMPKENKTDSDGVDNERVYFFDDEW